MIKHLTGIVIHKHVENMNLEFRGGRSEKAAKVHSILKQERQSAAEDKKREVPETYKHLPGGDFWAERGEQGRWVRIHAVPRLCSFLQ